MSVVIDEMEGEMEPEPVGPQRQQQQEQSQSNTTSKEAILNTIRSEMNRLAQREMRLRAD